MKLLGQIYIGKVVFFARLNALRSSIFVGRVKFPHVTEVEITNLEHTMNSVFTSDLAHHSALLLKNATSVFQSTHHKVVLLVSGCEFKILIVEKIIIPILK